MAILKYIKFFVGNNIKKNNVILLGDPCAMKAS